MSKSFFYLFHILFFWVIYQNYLTSYFYYMYVSHTSFNWIMNISSTFITVNSVRSDIYRTFYLFLVSAIFYFLSEYFRSIDIVNGAEYYEDETSLPFLILYFSIHISIIGLLSLSLTGLEYKVSRPHKMKVPDLSQSKNEHTQYQTKNPKINIPYSRYAFLKNLQTIIAFYIFIAYILNTFVLAIFCYNYITFEPPTCACGH